MIKIKMPIWKNKSVGIAESKMVGDVVKMKILYKTVDGERLYPGMYWISRARAMMYPVQVVRGGVKLRIIPIEDFEAREE